MLLQLQLPIRSATNDSYLFFPLETSGLPYVEHSVEEQSLAHQVCLKNEVFVRLTADWTEPSSAVCSGPPELLLVSVGSGRARFVIRKKK